MEEFGRIIFIFASIYLIYLLLYRFVFVIYQKKQLYPSVGVSIKELEPGQLKDLEIVFFSVRGGNVESWFFGDRKKRPVIMVFHGNSGTLETNYLFALELQKKGYHVMVVEYPGYGRSTGKPSEASFQELVEKAFDWVKSKKEVSNIIVYGNSLGGCVAGLLIGKKPIDLLILKSTFSSIARFISKMLYVPKFMVVDKFETENRIKLLDKPILIMHSKEDQLVPFAQAEILHGLATNSELAVYKGKHEGPDHIKTIEIISKFIGKHINSGTT
ncbi:alpha/beta hydrolase [Aliikangiella maris]|uniref:Alpha/beta fold hydrolase n=2 Tax=Aliikangiella maris TaxID=3162458 RepID=A0ABV3MTZ2_9GAMM